MEERLFAFGKNWQNFLKSVNQERINIAKSSLTDFLQMDNLAEKRFLDIGCGSGLFSYAAFLLGAKEIVSFDIDPFSVKCCQYFYDQAKRPAHWKILTGSVLNKNFISKLGQFDIVYSWGVLHHTGDMWRAIKNSSQLVKEGGHYYIAIYNKVYRPLSSEAWLKIKKIYNRLPKIGKAFLDLSYIAVFFILRVIKLQNPVQYIRNYRSFRGMNFFTDVRDWLGGYPYEFATKDEIVSYMQTNSPDLRLKKIKETNSIGNNWFLFQHRRNQERGAA